MFSVENEARPAVEDEGGGTGSYVRSVIEGLKGPPERQGRNFPAALRAQLRAEWLQPAHCEPFFILGRSAVPAVGTREAGGVNWARQGC